MTYLLSALAIVFTPVNIAVLLISTFAGLIMGMLPGLSATMAVALLTGLTYSLPHQSAIISLIGVFVPANSNVPAAIGDPSPSLIVISAGVSSVEPAAKTTSAFHRIFRSFIGCE